MESKRSGRKAAERAPCTCDIYGYPACPLSPDQSKKNVENGHLPVPLSMLQEVKDGSSPNAITHPAGPALQGRCERCALIVIMMQVNERTEQLERA